MTHENDTSIVRTQKSQVHVKTIVFLYPFYFSIYLFHLYSSSSSSAISFRHTYSTPLHFLFAIKPLITFIPLPTILLSSHAHSPHRNRSLSSLSSLTILFNIYSPLIHISSHYSDNTLSSIFLLFSLIILSFIIIYSILFSLISFHRSSIRL